jgi:hypothetical protein
MSPHRKEQTSLEEARALAGRSTSLHWKKPEPSLVDFDHATFLHLEYINF